MLIISLVFSIFINICLVVAVFGFMEQEAQQYLIIRHLKNRIEHMRRRKESKEVATYEFLGL